MHNQEQKEHQVFARGRLIKSFTYSYWYDTATPYQWCVRELKALKQKVTDNEALTITSMGITYLISNELEFYNWVANIFGGGFEEFL